MKLQFIVAGLTVCIVLSGCSSPSTEQSAPSVSSQSTIEEQIQATPTPTPEQSTPNSYWDILLGTGATNQEVCDSYEDVISKFETAADKRNADMKGKLKDAYVASSFRKGKNWLTSDFSDEFKGEVEATVLAALNLVSGDRASEILDLSAYKSDSFQLCSLSERYSRVESSVAKAQGTASDIVIKAATKPWYSKGYREYSDGLAYKYTTFSGGDPCGYSRCTFAKVTVQSRDGCYGGLYGELNFMDDNDNIRDWDIDSVPAIYPKEKATLDFITYSFLDSSTARLISLSCY